MSPGSRKLVYLAPTTAELDDTSSRKPQAFVKSSSRLSRESTGSISTLKGHSGNRINKKRQIRSCPAKSDQKISSLVTSIALPSEGEDDKFSSIIDLTEMARSAEKVESKPLLARKRQPLKLLSTSSIHQSEYSPSSKIESDAASEACSAFIAPQSDQQSEQEGLENTSKLSKSAKEEEKLSVRHTSKAENLRLGPARTVGLRRRNNQRSIIFPAPTVVSSFQNNRVLEQRPGPKPLTTSSTIAADWSNLEGSIGGTTTIESIPPPPTHLFTLSSITSIYSLLSSPNTFISSHQGGSQHEASLKFNLLGLVIRIEGLESCLDWRAGGGQMMDRCEMIVKDASDCTLKVVLEGDCATRWASTKSSQSYQMDLESSEYSHETNPFEASISALNETSNFANRSELEVQRLNKLFPLRPGDVIVMSRLALTRPQKKGKNSITETKLIGPATVFAVASPRWEPHLELCWRNDIRSSADQRRNFDQSLTAFDARCRAIFRLAKSWSA